MKYLIININGISNEALAQGLSAALWNITRPDKGANETQFYCVWVHNADNTLCALCLPEDDTQPIHLNSENNITELCDAIAGNITEQEKIDLNTFLMESRGNRINIVSSLPQTLQNVLMTEEQMKAYGFFQVNE